jgi:hypothetical protein
MGELNPSILDSTTFFPRFSSMNEFMEWYRHDPPPYDRWSRRWWTSKAWLMLMFAVTGSSALTVVRFVLSKFDIDASLFHGDAKHRAVYMLCMIPTYTALTVVVGFAFGRGVFARKMAQRMMSRWTFFVPWLRKIFKK